MGIILLESERLIIRDLNDGDWEYIYNYRRDPDFNKYDYWGADSPRCTQRAMQERVDHAQSNYRHRYDFAFCRKGDGYLVGDGGLRLESCGSGAASIGWAIHPDRQGKGLATEAAHVLLRYGFDTLGLKLIHSTCDERNTASRKVMEKIGMTHVGIQEFINFYLDYSYDENDDEPEFTPRQLRYEYWAK